jgi:hypothetical protein
MDDLSDLVEACRVNGLCNYMLRGSGGHVGAEARDAQHVQ